MSDVSVKRACAPWVGFSYTSMRTIKERKMMADGWRCNERGTRQSERGERKICSRPTTNEGWPGRAGPWPNESESDDISSRTTLRSARPDPRPDRRAHLIDYCTKQMKFLFPYVKDVFELVLLILIPTVVVPFFFSPGTPLMFLILSAGIFAVTRVLCSHHLNISIS